MQSIKSSISRLVPDYFPHELKSILKLAWPIILMNLFRFINPTVSIIMCGHLNKLDFDASSLANGLINVFGVSIDLGFSTACDTLFAQIYGGKNKRKLGLMLQRSILVMTVIYLLLCCVHLNIEPILIWLNQDVYISRKTARYVALYLPGLFFDFQFLTLSRYLQNQNVVYPMMISAGIGSVFNGVSQYIAMYTLGYGIDASAICQASACVIMFAIQLIYVLVSKVYKDTWQGIEVRQSFEAWGIFFKLGLPGIVMIGVEEWAFEIANFLAGSLSATQLGAQSVAFNTEFLCYTVHVGLAIAAAIRCGQFLGANKPREAANCAKIVLFTDVVISVIFSILLLSLRTVIPYVFTSDPDIHVVAERIIIILAIIQFFDAGCSSTAGIFRACGRQLNGAIVMVTSYYFLGVPLGLVLIFVAGMDIMGFWIGLLVGLAFEVTVYMIMLYRINWEKEAAKARQNEKQSKLGKNDDKDDLSDEEDRGLLDGEFLEEDNGHRSGYTRKKSASMNFPKRNIDMIHHRSVSGVTDILRSWAHETSSQQHTDSPISNHRDPNVVLKRAILVSITLLLFFGSLIIKMVLPRGLYVPCIPVNGNFTTATQIALDKHYPLCNDTIYRL